MRWKKVGNACSKEFFQAHKDWGVGSCITELEDEEGILQSNQVSLERICSNYYAKLYSAAPLSPAKEEAESQCLRGIRGKVTRAMKDSLQRPISLGELKGALKGMDANKAPGPDGVITGFF